jgi:hypothetical protein
MTDPHHPHIHDEVSDPSGSVSRFATNPGARTARRRLATVVVAAMVIGVVLVVLAAIKAMGPSDPIRRAEREIEQQNVAGAKAILDEACRDGHGPSCVRLPLMMRWQKVSFSDVEQADALRRACDLRTPNGCAAFAALRQIGAGGGDLSEAEAAGRNGCSAGDVGACGMVKVIAGLGGPHNIIDVGAIELAPPERAALERLCEDGWAEVCFALAVTGERAARSGTDAAALAAARAKVAGRCPDIAFACKLQERWTAPADPLAPVAPADGGTAAAADAGTPPASDAGAP